MLPYVELLNVIGLNKYFTNLLLDLWPNNVDDFLEYIIASYNNV